MRSLAATRHCCLARRPPSFCLAFLPPSVRALTGGKRGLSAACDIMMSSDHEVAEPMNTLVHTFPFIWLIYANSLRPRESSNIAQASCQPQFFFGANPAVLHATLAKPYATATDVIEGAESCTQHGTLATSHEYPRDTKLEVCVRQDPLQNILDIHRKRL